MILCLGTTPVFQRSMTFERVRIDGVNRAVETRDYASGKSLNVARVLHTLGRDALAVGFAGGSRGKMILEDLDAAGIRHDFVTVAAETRQCVTVIDRASGSATELVEESKPVTQADWHALQEKLEQHLRQSSLWVFSGTLTPRAPPDFYARWLPLAREIGAQAIIDAKGEPLRLALKVGNAIFKLNREEFADTLGTELSDDAELVRAIRENIPPGGMLIITLGKAGAMGSDGRRVFRVHSPPVVSISAVGSGDSFSAGLGVALEEGRPLNEALQLAAACGAANAMTAYAGRLSRIEVGKLFALARVEQV